MQLDDINISEYFDSAIMPYGMKITHLPTGLSVRGNCKHEQSKLNLQKTLMDTLSIFVAQAEGDNSNLRRKSAAEIENEELKARLARLEAMIMRGGERVPAPKPQNKPQQSAPIINEQSIPKRGRLSKTPKPKEAAAGWTPERRAAAAQRMKDRQAAKYGLTPPAEPEPAPKIDTPMGVMTEQEFIRKAMRPATDPPQKLPKAHDSHGQTVVKSNVDWIKP
jgi:hypothetical protein